MYDVECPYCGEDQEINHDDGYGYDENKMHEQQCKGCDKNFTFTVSIIYSYEAQKAACLNGDPHKFKANFTVPIKSTRMVCEDCDAERNPTECEMASVVADRHARRETNAISEAN